MILLGIILFFCGISLLVFVGLSTLHREVAPAPLGTFVGVAAAVLGMYAMSLGSGLP